MKRNQWLAFMVATVATLTISYGENVRAASAFEGYWQISWSCQSTAKHEKKNCQSSTTTQMFHIIDTQVYNLYGDMICQLTADEKLDCGDGTLIEIYRISDSDAVLTVNEFDMHFVRINEAQFNEQLEHNQAEMERIAGVLNEIVGRKLVLEKIVTDFSDSVTGEKDRDVVLAEEISDKTTYQDENGQEVTDYNPKSLNFSADTITVNDEMVSSFNLVVYGPLAQVYASLQTLDGVVEDSQQTELGSLEIVGGQLVMKSIYQVQYLDENGELQSDTSFITEKVYNFAD